MTTALAIHLATVLPAFLIATWLIFFSVKGAHWHRVLGVAYLTLMSITVVATLFVRELNHGSLSWIHYVFIPLTVLGVGAGIWGAWTHNIRRHRYGMIGLYVGVVGAGTAALLPGRFLSRLLFS